MPPLSDTSSTRSRQVGLPDFNCPPKSTSTWSGRSIVILTTIFAAVAAAGVTFVINGGMGNFLHLGSLATKVASVAAPTFTILGMIGTSIGCVVAVCRSITDDVEQKEQKEQEAFQQQYNSYTQIQRTEALLNRQREPRTDVSLTNVEGLPLSEAELQEIEAQLKNINAQKKLLARSPYSFITEQVNQIRRQKLTSLKDIKDTSDYLNTLSSLDKSLRTPSNPEATSGTPPLYRLNEVIEKVKQSKNQPLINILPYWTKILITLVAAKNIETAEGLKGYLKSQLREVDEKFIDALAEDLHNPNIQNRNLDRVLAWTLETFYLKEPGRTF